MQQEFYTSCIKINGIPLLPPLITDSVKEEMRRYRSLAVKVEEKFKDRQVKCSIKDKCVQANIMESADTLKDIRYSSDSDLSNYNTTSDTNNSDTHSKMTIVEPPTIKQITGESAEEQNIETPTSDVQQSESQVLLINKTINESKSSSIDQNVNTIEVTSNEKAILSENWKPEVPRTLDIIPITLSDQEVTEEVTTVSKENENPPKLSRQGSYILDTPSPILLAHMHTELTDENYTPTTAMSQRKQWNIVQSKTEWENKQFIVKDTDTSNKSECKAEESISQHIKSNTLTELYQTNNSTSVETIISEQHIDATSIKHNYISNTDFKKQSSLEKNRNSDTSVSNVANKLQESTEDVNNSKKQLSHVDENKRCNKTEDTKKHKDVIVKTKSSITPEKLLTVYKEIEEMHKKQMMELINRQRREQSLLQAEFQKQQMLLLAEIRKCSISGALHPDLSGITSNQPNQPLPSKEVKLEDSVSEVKQQMNINSPGRFRVGTHCKLSSANVIVCPLDYISSKNLYMLKHKSPFIMNTSPTALNLDFARKVDLCDIAYTNNNNDNDNDHNSNYKSHDHTVYKSSSVSRQLFPLESNTTHVPVLDTSAYHEKHIRAVNIINAYARGYLVRRLMRTERVITLKKVYKEALQCMLKLHVDAPLNLAEVDFLHRLQLQCDAASLSIVELFAQSPSKRMQVIMQDREIQQSRAERPTSARSYSFATQKTLARKNLKEFESTMIKYQRPLAVKKCIVRTRCQTWTSDMRDRLMSPNALYQGIRRSTSTGAVRKPWR